MELQTPNKERIDEFEENMSDIYQYDRLKDCDLEFLQGLDYLIENHFMIFKNPFPHEDSPIQGQARAFLYDDPDDMKESLTDVEIIRLRLIREEMKVEIHRAIGHRKLLKREHRNKLANSLSDLANGILARPTEHIRLLPENRTC